MSPNENPIKHYCLQCSGPMRQSEVSGQGHLCVCDDCGETIELNSGKFNGAVTAGQAAEFIHEMRGLRKAMTPKPYAGVDPGFRKGAWQSGDTASNQANVDATEASSSAVSEPDRPESSEHPRPDPT